MVERMIRSDKGFLVLEPTPFGGFTDGGTIAHLGKMLVRWGWLPSMNEMRKLHGKGRFKVIPANGTSNIPIFATREINATFALFAGDVICSDDGTKMRTVTAGDFA